MDLRFSPRPYFKYFSCGPRFMNSLNSLSPPRRLVVCSARLLNSLSRLAPMQRMPFSCLVTVILVLFFLAGCGGYSSTASVNGGGPVAPYINTQPTNQTVAAGQTATFSVIAAGTAPLTYQWQKNGTDITGATSASYTTPVTATSDSGEMFRVNVSNSAGGVTSNAATLTVNASSSGGSTDVV